MKVIKDILSKNVRKYRLLSGLTQTGLAEQVGVQTQHISNIEKGRAFASADLMQRIAAALGVLPEELFYAGFDSSLLPGKLPAVRREIRRGLQDAESHISKTL